MTLINGATYRIVNAKSNTSLDLSGADNPFAVIGYDYHGGENQRWTIHHHGRGYSIRSVSGKFLGHHGQLRDDLPVVAVDEEVIWDIQPDADNHNAYRILVPDTPFNVDLSNYGSPDQGTPVALWGRWQPGVNQTWFFEQRKFMCVRLWDIG
ncbi:ricin B-like lectin [Pluteus cervinus]|uniref:Ricin B-like lectin n=1 Tax=Pluteus cervinus TaxID=181527 RepID=A0ACD3ABA8_9AGAR|nr:ricin B-like lectin [Pluteus cervinus]